MKRCPLCERIMLSSKRRWVRLYRNLPIADRMDCGGDCLRCIVEAERR